MDRESLAYGELKLIDKVKELKDKSAKEIVLGILDDVLSHSRHGEYSDDITLVAVKKIK